MAGRLLVIHGPNLDRLGEREVEVYGRETLASINERIEREAFRLGVSVQTIQTNHEGAIIDAIAGAARAFDGVVINPGAFSHYSLAIRDALAATRLPVVEVHLTNVFGREPFRHELVTAAACDGVIAGFGPEAYLLAVHAMVRIWSRQGESGVTP